MNNFEDNNVEPSFKRCKKRRVSKIKSGFGKWFLFCFFAVFLIALLINHTEVKNFITGVINSKQNSSNWEFSLPFSAKRQNILLLGTDVSENPDRPFDNTRSDSMYLITVAPHAKNISVISIPRDSKVYIHSRSNPDKINHAFAYGGINLTVKTVEQTLGVKINHYLVVSNYALVDFIDKIGGVDVYVEKDMYYNDNTANLHIDLKKGMQHLDGKAAEGFMRYRKDSLGDIGRIRRQQWFLNALAQKLKDPSTALKLPDIIKSVSKYIQTDFSVYELVQYAALVKSTDLSKIEIATLPGEPSQRGIVSYWILDPVGVQNLVNNLVYGKKPKAIDRALEAGILYTEDCENEAKTIGEKLEEKGISVVLRPARYLTHKHIAIHNIDLPENAILELKDSIPELKDKQSVYDIIGINKAARDFTVILTGS